METVISQEQAEKEWTDFLEDHDARGFLPNDDDDKEVKAQKQASFDKITKKISQGLIVIENGVLTQILKYPVKTTDGIVKVDKLVFDQRWTPKDREDIFKGMDTKDQSQLLIVQRRFCSILTGVEMIYLQKMDGQDYKITDLIVSVFFM